MAPISRDSWDNHVIVTRDGSIDATWDGKVKTLVWNPSTLVWEAMTQPGTSSGGSGSNAAASATGSAVPASASFTGFSSAGSLVGVSSANPMPVVQTGPPGLPTGAATDSAVTTMSAKLPATLGQKAMASSMAVTLASDQSAVPVSGTFWQTTQPVSGTFFQSTQPVSIASMPSTPVTGTFWQSTQPVSIASMPSTAVTNANLDVALSTRLKPADTLTGVTTVGAVTAITNALPIGANKIGTVDIATAAATAKGTQGANAVPTQDLHNAGRNNTHYFMALPIVTTATDALMSLTGYKSGAAVVATTTPAVVTSGKTYRITRVVITYVAIATAGTAKFTLRANTGGVVAIGSPAVTNWVLGAASATAGVSQSMVVEIPEALEFAAATGIGVSMVGLGATQTAAAVGYGLISIEGYEY